MITDLLINKILAANTETAQYLSYLNGKTIGITCRTRDDTRVMLAMYIIFEAASLHTTLARPQNIDCMICAPYPELINLFLHKHGNIQVQGEIELAAQFRALITNMQIDFTELLTPYLGDILATETTKGGQKLYNYFANTGRQLIKMGTEYLQEETRILPTEPELEEFAEQVHETRLAVDRLAAKIKQHANN